MRSVTAANILTLKLVLYTLEQETTIRQQEDLSVVTLSLEAITIR